MNDFQELEHRGRIRDSARIVVRRILRILHGCGLTASDLRTITETEIASLRDSAIRLTRASTGNTLLSMDVVLRWRRDPDFVDDNGLPRRLLFSRGSPNFAQLVDRVAPGESPSDILEVLRQTDSVRDVGSDQVELVTNSIVTCSGRDGHTVAAQPVLDHIGGFLSSVEHNLMEKPTRRQGRFERACYASIPRTVVPILESLVNSQGQEFVDAVDEWLSRRSIRKPRSGDVVFAGAGAYLFVHDSQDLI